MQSGDEAIVDPEWKERGNAKVGDTVELFERPFRIVGVYEPPGGGRIKIPLSTMQEQEGAANRASAILIACNDPAKQDEVAASILQRFPDDQLDLHARPSGDLRQRRSGVECIHQGRRRGCGGNQYAGDLAGDVHDCD